MKISDVFPAIHLHIVRKTNSKKRTMTIAELCAPTVLEILPDAAVSANGGKTARLRFKCHVSASTSEDVPVIAIKGTLTQEGKFFPAPAYLAKIMAQETALISGANAYHMAVETLRRAPGDMTIQWFGLDGKHIIWSTESRRLASKLPDLEAAITVILNTPLEIR